jgi:hypothetical protein
MSRLLLIHCPVNPRILHQAGASDIDFASPAESFRWSLVEHIAYGADVRVQETGEGPVSGMPFADEAIVLVPTADVRLIHTRVPLIGGKKLDSLLPTLTEPYLIDQRTPLRYQVFPPQAGSAAIERTIAVSSESWMGWLSQQLAALPVRSVSMIPDCLLLNKPDTPDEPRQLMRDSLGNFCVFSTREGYDWGAGWIEFQDSVNDTSADDSAQTQYQRFDWAWIAPAACAWLKQKTGINLILQAPVQPKKQRTKQTNVRWQPKVAWALWRQPLKLTGLAGIVYLGGSILYLASLGISDWRWQKITEETARQNLINPVGTNNAVLPAFIKQATDKIHAQGKDTQGDFIPLAGKLQVLLAAYPAGLLDTVTYQPGGLRFNLRNTKGVPDPEKFVQRARSLDLAVVSLGRNEYQLMPYAGLLGEGARP